MYLLKIGNKDFSAFVQHLDVEYNVLLSEDSGRNARGNSVIDIVNRKDKVYVSFIPMNDTEMQSLLNAIESYVVSVQYLNPKTKALKTISAYTSTPKVSYLWATDGPKGVKFNKLDLNFIEL